MRRYTYTITETVKEYTEENGWTVTGNEATVTVKVVDNGDGTLTASVETAATIKNSYAASATLDTSTEAGAVLKKTVEADGTAWAPKTFAFTITAVDGAPLGKDASGAEVTSGTATFKAAGTQIADFGKITYTKAGTYTYKVKETTASGDGWICDNEEKTVTVSVVDNGDGTLTATVSAVTITNTCEAAPPPPPVAEIKIRIVKQWEDNGNEAGKRPDSVTVTLLRNNEVAVVEKLNNGNSWQYEWMAVGGSNYSVIEDPVDGYETSIERSYYDNVITFTVTNKLIETPVLNTKDHVAYIVGYPDGTVRPGREITRAEVATIFFRLLTEEARDKYWSQTNPYPDVKIDDWFNNAISTLTNMGIINGYEDGTFRPNNPITRAELTKIAVSFFISADKYFGQVSSFSDVAADAWNSRFIAAAEELGLINGYPDGTFRPDNLITRAETCTIVNRTLGRVPHKDHLLPYMQMINCPDNADTNEWYYAQIQEATNSHDYVWTSDEIAATVEQWTAKLKERDWVALEQIWSNSHSAPGGEVMDVDPVPKN